MTVTYRVDGVALDDAAGRWMLRSGTLFGTGASRSVPAVSIPGVDGASPAGLSSLQTMTLVLQMDVLGESTADLTRNLSALTSLLSAPSMTVTRVADGVEYTAAGAGESVSQPEFVPSDPPVCHFTATLRLPGVFWRGQPSPWQQAAPVSGTAYPVTTLDGSTAPVDDALILIEGPVTNPKLACDGAWFRLGLTLAAGEAALVDCARWSVRAGAGVTLAGGGSVKTGVLTTSGGPYLLRLRPSMVGTDPTVTQVQASITADSGTPSLTIQAAPAYLA